MTGNNDVVELELEGWRALSATSAEARTFYDRVLDDQVLMLLPEGLILEGREAVLDSVSDQSWTSFELHHPVVLEPSPQVAVVAYTVVAHRANAPAYTAQVSSTYILRTGGWKLALHQQTPS